MLFLLIAAPRTRVRHLQEFLQPNTVETRTTSKCYKDNSSASPGTFWKRFHRLQAMVFKDGSGGGASAANLGITRPPRTAKETAFSATTTSGLELQPASANSPATSPASPPLIRETPKAALCPGSKRQPGHPTTAPARTTTPRVP